MPREALPSPADPGPYRALVRPPKARHIEVIDQRALPHALVKVTIGDAEAAALAIRRMWIRGAPLIGAVGAYGLALALDRDAERRGARQGAHGARRDAADRRQPALGARSRAREGCAAAGRGARRRRVGGGRRDRAEDVAINHAIGEHGLALLRGIAQRRPGPDRA